MALPVTVPNSFANATASIPLSQLDANFGSLSNAINGIANGVETLANVQVTGGSLDNVSLSNVVISGETLDNVTLTNVLISSGNATVTNLVCTTANASVGNITTLNATTVNSTNLDLTSIEVTNIKAKDGTAAATIADSTGKMTVTSEFAVDNLNFSVNTISSTDTNGNIFLTPDGTGEVNISKVDIDAGAIDGTTIGASSAAAGTFTTLTSNSTTTLDGTTIPTSKTLLVTTDIGSSVQAYDAQLADIAGLTPADGSFIVGNGTNFITEDGATARTSLGLGSISTQAADNVNIDGGAVDAVTLGTNSAITEAQIDNVNINNNAIVSTNTDGNLSLTPNGTGNLVLDGLNWPQADGDPDYVLKTNGSGQLAWTAQSGGGGTPGGSDTQIQYNNAGSFAGASGLVTDGSNLTINAQGDVRFADSDSSNWVAFQAPATVASNVTWTLPDADGTDGQVIKTNGTGTLSWITPSAGGGGTSVTVTQITATAAQTDFSVTYTVGQLSVYLNGALLASADYTASNGTTVVLAAGAASGDIFTAVAYDSATQITQGDTAVEVSDTGSDGTITGTADNTAVFSVEKGKTFVLQGGVSSTGVGIAFPADQTTVGASSDANTLDDYEEGTWTPIDSSGAGLTFASPSGKYTKIGRQVTAWAALTYPSTADGSNSAIGGLPFTIFNSAADRGGGMIGYKADSTLTTILGEENTTFVAPRSNDGSRISNATLSGDLIHWAITYNVS
jgi:hypothetical protein